LVVDFSVIKLHAIIEMLAIELLFISGSSYTKFVQKKSVAKDAFELSPPCSLSLSAYLSVCSTLVHHPCF